MVIMHGIVTALRWRSRVKRAWIQVSLAVGMVFVRLAASFTYLLGSSSIGNLSTGNGMELEPEECSRVYMDFIYNTHGTWWVMDRVFSNPDIVEKIVDDDNASNMRVVSRTGRDAVRDAVLRGIEEMLEYIYEGEMLSNFSVRWPIRLCDQFISWFRGFARPGPGPERAAGIRVRTLNRMRLGY